MNLSTQQLAVIFEEWAKRHRESPAEFDDDPTGPGLGEERARYFEQIARDLGFHGN